MEPITYDSLVYILSFTTEIERLNIRLVCKDWYEAVKSITYIADPITLIDNQMFLSYIKTINTNNSELYEKKISIYPCQLLKRFCTNSNFGLIKLSFDRFINDYSLPKYVVSECVADIISFKQIYSPRNKIIRKCYYRTPTPKKVEILQWFALRGYYDTDLTPYHAAVLNNIDLMGAIHPDYDSDDVFAALMIAIDNKNIKIVKSIIYLPKFEINFADFLTIYEKSKAVGKMIIDETDIFNIYKLFKIEKIRSSEIYNYFRQKLKPILDEEAMLLAEWDKFRTNFAKIETKLQKQLARNNSYRYCIEADISNCLTDRTDLQYSEFYKAYHEPQFTMLCFDKINWSKYSWVKDIESFDKIKVQLTVHNT
ncbi:hypothetical protein PV-S19_0313 [Pacmanvirus S19]|nr:hypothetical protein PV-S19_0313 [Pacmanvirus S19]